jgi:hypothetical protein
MKVEMFGFHFIVMFCALSAVDCHNICYGIYLMSVSTYSRSTVSDGNVKL